MGPAVSQIHDGRSFPANDLLCSSPTGKKKLSRLRINLFATLSQVAPAVPLPRPRHIHVHLQSGSSFGSIAGMSDETRDDSPDAPASAAGEEAAATAILQLTGACAPGKTVSPLEVAQLLVPGSDQWQRALPAVRRAAVRLALDGQLLIYRKGKVVDPQDFRGVYRLGPPQNG